MILIAGGSSAAVDFYSVATGAWSTAQLSVARESLAATSVGTLALIVGGENEGLLFFDGYILLMIANASILSLAHYDGSLLPTILWCFIQTADIPLQVAPLMPWMCTTVQQGFGPQLSSA